MKKTFLLILFSCLSLPVFSQTSVDTVEVNPTNRFQTIEGFGGSIAWYENWLIAHPYKNEIYDALFNELDLDILRIRNTHDYDSLMVVRMSQIIQGAETSAGNPIKILATSWGPPAYLKSNNDINNGGTLTYTVQGSTVQFDYAGFTSWWEASLDEYNTHGIFPTYISIQNEPDYTAAHPSCRLDPSETIHVTDTIAGYNQALDSVYHMIQTRTNQPKILGPDVVGVGYGTFQNYIGNLDTSFLYGVSHHLYTGASLGNPWIGTAIALAGSTVPEIPHFQTEFGDGDWFDTGALLYKSLNDENVVSYLFWKLIWNGSGLVHIENPWNPSSWTTSNGYIRSKHFYAFKQFSAFIHPEWERMAVSVANDSIKSVAFISPTEDSASIVLINHSTTNSYITHISIPAYLIDSAFAYRTSVLEDCFPVGALPNPELTLPPHSITTVKMHLSKDSSVSVICATDIYEGNNTKALAAPFSASGLSGKMYICPQGDVDWYRFFNGFGNASLVVKLWNLPANYDVELHDGAGLITSSYNGGTANEKIVYPQAPKGWYYVKVYGVSGARHPAKPYSLEIFTVKKAIMGTKPVITAAVFRDDFPGISLDVFPNPATGLVNLHLSLDQSAEAAVRLTDLAGRVLISEMHTTSAGLNALQLDLTGLQDGAYLLEVNIGLHSWARKLVVLRE